MKSVGRWRDDWGKKRETNELSSRIGGVAYFLLKTGEHDDESFCLHPPCFLALTLSLLELLPAVIVHNRGSEKDTQLYTLLHTHLQVT